MFISSYMYVVGTFSYNVAVLGFFELLMQILANIGLNGVHRYEMHLFPRNSCRNKL